MATDFDHWTRTDTDAEELATVQGLAHSLRDHLREPEVQAAIAAVNKPGVHSARIQATVLAHATDVRFKSEKQGIFKGYDTPGLRPDYYLELPQHQTGIIFEVERGKTTINNMDLLDLWKCHICATAHHLFLMVPSELRQNETDGPTRPFAYVQKRLPSFFRDGNYVNVRSCWLYGY